MFKKLLFTIVFILIATAIGIAGYLFFAKQQQVLAAGNIINAASCSQTDVQAAINQAVDGDTVMVPVGSCVWTTIITNTPSVAISKGITLQGAGIDSTIITDNTGKTDNGNETSILITGSSGKNIRITGLTFSGTGDSKGAIRIVGPTASFWKGFRIDNSKFTILGAGISINYAYGLIDHCIFSDSVKGLINISVFGIGHWYNNLSFSQINPAGTDAAVYVEDNTFNNPLDQSIAGEIDAYDGAHFVFRHNTVNNGGIQTHETGYTGLRGVRHYEIYSNVFNTTATLARAIFLRGGTGVIYDNIFSGSYNNCVDLDNYRTYDISHNIAGYWGYCDGTNNCDGNISGMNGYPCMDQIGRITDQGLGSASACYQSGAGSGPTQPLEPLYAWNNKCKSASYNASLRVSGGCRNGVCATDHIQPYRDYYDETQKPNYTPYTYPHPLIVATSKKGDFNLDDKVNNLDFTSFKSVFKSVFNSIFDLNSDSAIDVKDLGVLMSGWLP